MAILGCFLGVSTLSAAEMDPRLDATVLAVEKVMPSVVNIATETIVRVQDPFEQFFRNFWNPYHRNQPPNSTFSLGSGVMIDESGYLLTNDHVVRRADKIAVKFATGTNVYAATVVAHDPKTDVALLKLAARPGEKFQAIKFARDDDLLLGETVLAMGNPFGLGGSVSRGILSSKSRLAPVEGMPLDVPNWLQTDASINQGSSGGPLVNVRGELIGINVAMLPEAQGIGFAIPVKRILQALGDIFPTEFVKSYWFGARVRVGSTPLIVGTVHPGSPAAQGGLRVGDAILEVNGTEPRSFIDFAELLARDGTKPVRLTTKRGNDRQYVTVRLVPEQNVFNAEMIRQKLGLNLADLTPETAAGFGIRNLDGFLVTGVETGGPAARAGLDNGMVVTAIEGQAPPDVTSAAKLLYAKKSGERIHLDIAFRQHRPGYDVLRQGAVELPVR